MQSSLETRLAKLETVGQTQRREYTDAERAVRVAYIFATGGPTAERVREILAKADKRTDDQL